MSLEKRFNLLEAKVLAIEKKTNSFFATIRSEKPESIVSNNAMQKILKLFPRMRANQIDDFLLQRGIGDVKALKDFLDLEEKNRNNQSLVGAKHD